MEERNNAASKKTHDARKSITAIFNMNTADGVRRSFNGSLRDAMISRKLRRTPDELTVEATRAASSGQINVFNSVDLFISDFSLTFQFRNKILWPCEIVEVPKERTTPSK